MVTEKTKKMFNWVLNLTILTLLVFAVIRYSSKTDEGEFDHCVEWDGWIYREDLLWQCFNWKEQRPVCNWEIETNGVLTFYNIGDKEDILEQHICTRKVKSINLYPDGIPTLEEYNIEIE